RSPLHELDPETFAAVTGSGPADVGFRMALPMVEHGVLAIEGDVRLDGASLADPRWSLAFDQVRGPVRYSQRGFRADRLGVRLDGRPGKLSLRSGVDAVRDRRNVLEADLEAQFGADALLARASELDWLAPYMHGQSSWTAGLVVPESGSGDARTPRLTLRSTLVGTALSLPAPLDKPAARPLATRVEMPLPLDSGEIQVALGDVLGLRARSHGARTGIRVALGSATVSQPAPASGLIVDGHAPVLDAIGWIGLVRGGDSGGDGGLALGRIDVRVDALQMLGATFRDSRLRVSPEAGGALAVQVEGPMLQGRLRVPGATNATVSGRFERVHWRLPVKPEGGASSAPATPVPVVDNDIDPARIPPLALDIDDLCLADAALGSAS